MKRRSIVLASVACLGAGWSTTLPIQAQAPTVTNVGLAADNELRPDGKQIAFLVNEANQGGTDLNGDGDAVDSVLFLRAVGTSTTNYGYVPAPPNYEFRLAGNVLAFSASEFQFGSDLNGDGDMIDSVLQVANTSSGTTTNVGVAESPGMIAIDGRIVAFAVPEAAQGATNLNGDGDATDTVAHYYDTTGLGALTNLSLAVGTENSVQLGGGVIGMRVSEAAQGNSNLNLDTDTSDFVLHVHRISTGTTQNLGRAVAAQENVSGSTVAFQVWESGQGGTDLNGDGDAVDHVVHEHKVASGVTTNLGLASAYTIIELDQSLFAFQVNEITQGSVDLNGDGDTSSDNVLFTRQGTTTTNLGLATCIPSFSLAGRVVAAGISEQFQGATDLNGDGDTGDCVLHVHRVGVPTVNVGKAISLQPAGNGASVISKVSEAGQGGTDLNGDGDAADTIAHTYDVVSGTTTNLGFQTTLLALSDRLWAFGVSESHQGGTDLNGDGDTSDLVLHVHDYRSGITFNLGYAVSPYTRVAGRLVAFHVTESGHGGADLNGDGDTSDLVLFEALFP